MDALLRFFNLYEQSTESEAERAQAQAWLREGFTLLLPTVPAMLVSGEQVLNSEASKLIGDKGAAKPLREKLEKSA